MSSIINMHHRTHSVVDGYTRQGFVAVNSVGLWERQYGIGATRVRKMGHVSDKGLGKYLQGIPTPLKAVGNTGRGSIGFHNTERHQRFLDALTTQKYFKQWKRKTTSTVVPRNIVP